MFGQGLCNTSISPTQIYYPNTAYTPTAITGNEYLCGPNTIVYDTLGYSCFIYVNSNCTLTLKPNISACMAQAFIYLKNNSVLNLVQGSGPLEIISEPLAIINNPYGLVYSSNSCTAITFPVVNCTTTGLNELKTNNEQINIYPNPASELLNVELGILNAKLEIINSVGQIIREEEITLKDNKAILTTKDLQNGIYFLKFKSENSFVISKRFVVAR